MNVGSIMKQIKVAGTCEDYSPCDCSQLPGDGLNSITCDNDKIPEIMDAFNRTHTIELGELRYFSTNALVIPDNMISDKKVGRLLLECKGSAISIERDAFNSTRQYTANFEIRRCLALYDLCFAEGFTKLSYLNFYNVEMGKLFSTFPSNIPSINNLKIVNGFGWNNLMNLPSPSPVVGATNLDRLEIPSQPI